MGSPDTLTITSNGREVSTWEEFSVSRGIETMPSSFTAKVTEQMLQGRTVDLQPFESFTARLGDELVITGYLDDLQLYSSAGVHGVTISGRGRCQDLVDCSHEIEGAFVNAPNVLALAQELAKPYGISVSSKAGAGRALHQLPVNVGQTAFDVLEPIAAYSGFLVYDDPGGNLVLGQLAEGRMASGFVQGHNVEQIAVTFSASQRYSDYEVYWQSVDAADQVQNSANNKHGHAEDRGVPRNRKLKIVSDQIIDGKDVGDVVAAWHMQRRWGRSQQARITCSTWRDSAGRLWQPNHLARLHAPRHKLPSKEWLIAGVTYNKGRSGTTADVVMMPKEAFTIQPVNPYSFDWVLQREIMAERDRIARSEPGAQGSGQ